MAKSSIEWTESTWNPITGCTKVSPGCLNCYAETMAKRLRAMGQPNYRNGFDVSIHEHVIERPLQWKKSQIVFVNSMSDLFHEQVPLDIITRIFSVMNKANWHQYQILTKRPARLKEIDYHLHWSDHIWMGVSVEDEQHKYRIDHLNACRAKVKFLSLEPLIGPVGKLGLAGIDWVIVGGESGPRARPMEENWVVDIRDQCLDKGIPFFFKQWGGVNKKKAGRMLQGKVWSQMPDR